MKMKSVNYDHGRGHWCGPTVIAAITGRPYSVVAKRIRELTGRKSIMGTASHELEATLASFGYSMFRTGFGETVGDPTLARWARKRTAKRRAQMCIVEVTGHWVLVHRRWFLDSKTGGVPVLLKEAPGRRARVKRVWAVTKA